MSLTGLIGDYSNEEINIISHCHYRNSRVTDSFYCTFKYDSNGGVTHCFFFSEESGFLLSEYSLLNINLHSYNDEPAITHYHYPQSNNSNNTLPSPENNDDMVSNKKQYVSRQEWFENGIMSRNNPWKPHIITYYESGRVKEQYYNHEDRSLLFPSYYQFEHNGMIAIVSWGSHFDNNESILTSCYYNEHGGITEKRFNDNSNCPGGVILCFNNNRLSKVSLESLYVRKNNNSIPTSFSYHKNNMISEVDWLEMPDYPHRVSGPVHVFYSETGDIIEEMFFINGVKYENKKKWLENSYVQKYYRNLKNHDSMGTNIKF